MSWRENEWINLNTHDLSPSPIDEGSFGEVYSFFDKSTGIRKALKVIIYEKYLEATNSKIELESWFEESLEEINNLRRLRGCKFIPDLEDYYIDIPNRRLYLVTMLAQSNLSEYIKGLNTTQIKHIPLSNLRRIIECVLRALQYAHSNNIVHGDINCEKILITTEGNFLLADWGISRIRKISKTQKIISKILENSAYLAPYFCDDVNKHAKFFKVDSIAAGLLCLVCCGFPETQMNIFETEKLKDLTAWIASYFSTNALFIPHEIRKLIQKLIENQTETRNIIEDSLRFCEENKIFDVKF